jgi:hypothetical protein
LRQYAASGPILMSVAIWPDAASAENAMRSGLVTWEMIQSNLTPDRLPIVHNPVRTDIGMSVFLSLS